VASCFDNTAMALFGLGLLVLTIRYLKILSYITMAVVAGISRCLRAMMTRWLFFKLFSAGGLNSAVS